jgi:hypothetical protein
MTAGTRPRSRSAGGARPDPSMLRPSPRRLPPRGLAQRGRRTSRRLLSRTVARVRRRDGDRSHRPMSSVRRTRRRHCHCPRPRLTDQGVEVNSRRRRRPRRSSRKNTIGLPAKARAKTTFCRPAAAELAAGWRGPRARRRTSRRRRQHRSRRHRRESAAETESARRRRVMFADRPRGRRPLRAPLARDVASPGPGGCGFPTGAVGQADDPASRPLGADGSTELALPC